MQSDHFQLLSQEVLMRRLALAILTIATMSVAAPAAAQTYAPGYPVCLHVYGPVSYNECAYTSLAQCNASASGRPADCSLNPYAARAEGPSGRSHRQYRPAY
jgi:hypothetical protein